MRTCVVEAAQPWRYIGECNRALVFLGPFDNSLLAADGSSSVLILVVIPFLFFSFLSFPLFFPAGFPFS